MANQINDIIQNNGHNLITNDDQIETKLLLVKYFQMFLQMRGLRWQPCNETELNENDNDINNLIRRQNTTKLTKIREISEHLIMLSNDLLDTFGEHIDDMCEKLSNNLSNYDDNITQFADVGNRAFISIANELFGEGIKWGHILTLFVFTSELAVYYYRKNLNHLIDEIVLWLLSYVKMNLLRWIVNHGGWEGFIAFSRGHDVIDGGLIRNNGSMNKNYTLGKRAMMALVGCLSFGGIIFLLKKVQSSA